MLHIHFFKKGGSRKQRKNEEASITYGQHGLPGEVTSKKKEKASFANKQKKKYQVLQAEQQPGQRTPLGRGACFLEIRSQSSWNVVNKENGQQIGKVF